jgi:hypothetical protein
MAHAACGRASLSFAPARKGISLSLGELRQEMARSHEELKDVVLCGNR